MAASAAAAPPPAVVASSPPNVVAAAVSASLNPPYGLLPAAAAALSSAEAHAAASSPLRRAPTAPEAAATAAAPRQGPGVGGGGPASAAATRPWCSSAGAPAAAAAAPAPRAKPAGEPLPPAAAASSSVAAAASSPAAAAASSLVPAAASSPAAAGGCSPATAGGCAPVAAAGSASQSGAAAEPLPPAGPSAASASSSSSAAAAPAASRTPGRSSIYAGHAATAAAVETAARQLRGAAGGGRRSLAWMPCSGGGAADETAVSLPCAPPAASLASLLRPPPAVSSSAAAAAPGCGGASSSRSSVSPSSSSSSSRPGAAAAARPVAATEGGGGAAAAEMEEGEEAEAKELKPTVLTLHQREVHDPALPLSPSSLQVTGDQRQSDNLQQWTLDLAPAMVGHADSPKMLFIFINPTSGGNKAAAFTESGVCRMTLTTPFFCNMYIFDIREGKSGEKPGFLLLKAATELLGSARGGYRVEEPAASPAAADAEQQQQQGNGRQGREGGQQLQQQGSETAPAEQRRGDTGEEVIRVLVAGGDGTVMWVAMEAEAHHIDLEKIAVGVIPYGTGNDFATAFGWKQVRGLRPFDVAMRTMRSLMVRWSDALVVRHDLWNVFIALCEDGCFTRINSRSRKKEVMRDETGETSRTMSLVMSNYFSIGVESRIGRGFDRRRGRSRIFNKLTYGVEGFKVACFKRTPSIDQVVDALFEKPGEPEEEVIFRTRGSEVTHGPFLKKAVSLILCNIPSFGAGNDIWGNSNRIGFVVKKRGTAQWGKRAEEVIKEKQCTGDGELEFLTFPSTASLGLEFACHGRAQRLHQGSGPWKITFKDLPLAAKVYFQVDGEFFQMKRPLHVMVKHNRTLKVLASRFDKHLHAR